MADGTEKQMETLRLRVADLTLARVSFRPSFFW
jgi:hypothetical protein